MESEDIRTKWRMGVPDKCSKCGEGEYIDSKLMSTMATLFVRPRDMKHMTLYMGSPFHSKVCDKCGFMEFYVDVEIFNSLRKGEDEKQ